MVVKSTAVLLIHVVIIRDQSITGYLVLLLLFFPLPLFYHSNIVCVVKHSSYLGSYRCFMIAHLAILPTGSTSIAQLYSVFLLFPPGCFDLSEGTHLTKSIKIERA